VQLSGLIFLQLKYARIKPAKVARRNNLSEPMNRGQPGQNDIDVYECKSSEVYQLHVGL
jgi:hypothetical protein